MSTSARTSPINTGRPIRVRNPDTRDELADAFLHSTGADIREGHGEAYYVPSRDFISMPAFAGFKGADHFYNVAFHELTHWSGHKSRLNRDLKNRFGSRDYAAEELIAELGAASGCAPSVPDSGENAATGRDEQSTRPSELRDRAFPS
jgi:antirestriction protein ArdC